MRKHKDRIPAKYKEVPRYTPDFHPGKVPYFVLRIMDEIHPLNGFTPDNGWNISLIQLKARLHVFFYREFWGRTAMDGRYLDDPEYPPHLWNCCFSDGVQHYMWMTLTCVHFQLILSCKEYRDKVLIPGKTNGIEFYGSLLASHRSYHNGNIF